MLPYFFTLSNISGVAGDGDGEGGCDGVCVAPRLRCTPLPRPRVLLGSLSDIRKQEGKGGRGDDAGAQVNNPRSVWNKRRLRS